MRLWSLWRIIDNSCWCGRWNTVWQDSPTRNFILTNIVQKGEHFTWRINLDTIQEDIQGIIGFPQFDTKFNGKCLFLGGSQSLQIRLIIRAWLELQFVLWRLSLSLFSQVVDVFYGSSWDVGEFYLICEMGVLSEVFTSKICVNRHALGCQRSPLVLKSWMNISYTQLLCLGTGGKLETGIRSVILGILHAT